jgi:hypothetical protein
MKFTIVCLAALSRALLPSSQILGSLMPLRANLKPNHHKSAVGLLSFGVTVNI